MTLKLQIVGGGRMGGALVTGLVAAGFASADELVVVEPFAERRAELSGELTGLQVEAAPVECADAVIAVKPDHVAEAVRQVVAAGAKRLLSIAAGVGTDVIAEVAGSGVAVVRAMPNTPALVGAGASAVAAGPGAGDADIEWAESVLGAVGVTVRVSERQLDAVTGLSGSGPAYVFLVAEALIEAGVLNGLPRDVATTLALSTVLGAARLMTETGDDPETLRAGVTSPGGTTAAGLRVLEQAAVRAAFLDAVTAATQRSAELGGR